MSTSTEYARVAAEDVDVGPGPVEPGPVEPGAPKGEPVGAAASRARTVMAVGGYMLISSTLLIVNKLAVSFLPLPSTILSAQLGFAALVTWVLGRAGVIEVDALTWETCRKFWLVPAVFLATVFANIKTLQTSNVETFIVFRASAPLALSVLDAVYLGRALPSTRSAACLLGILLSGVAYLAAESATLRVDSLAWATFWYASFLCNQIYIKHIVETVPMTTWGRVFYSNLLPLAPLLVINAATGEMREMRDSAARALFTQQGLFWLTVSCLLGTLMSFAAFAAREQLTATAFSVVGDACKALSILINVLMWDQHASPTGVVALLACLGFACLYQQAPLAASDEARAAVRRQLRVLRAAAVAAAVLALLLYGLLRLATGWQD
jgi:solute carrier family 35 protein